MSLFAFDEHPDPSTPEKIRNILISTSSFSNREIEVAMDLVRENLEKGRLRSGYFFLLARDESGQMAGFTCFGPIPCTLHSYDLYWIAVHKDFQGMGLGRKLYLETEKKVKKQDGKKIFAETSGRKDYHSARKFYQSLEFKKICRIGDFYAPGDDKVIYQKDI